MRKGQVYYLDINDQIGKYCDIKEAALDRRKSLGLQGITLRG